MKTGDVLIYDTTLRDGTQGEQINFSAEEKLRIAQRLDEMGFHYIEGGWPSSNPKDMRFFEMAKKVRFKHARLTAFSSTRKANTHSEDCPNLNALLEADTPTVTIFGKTWDLHVTEILGVSLEENEAMIWDSIRYMKSKGKEVVYDAEHFFDGFKNNERYACKTVKTALAAGADFIVLCDTNGGTMPHELSEIIDEVKNFIPSHQLGIHVHNDCGLAVANSVAAARAGVRMVQGTINGYGERCGNADLIPIIANLQVKLGMKCLPENSVRNLTSLSNFVSEVANVPILNSRPFVGKSAFAHKGGVHVSAILKNAAAYEHIKPERVGNLQRVLVSDLSGKSNIEYKARELGVSLGLEEDMSRKIVRKIKEMEDRGYQFDAADGSLALLMKKATGEFEEPFTLECFHVITSQTSTNPAISQATIKISVGGEVEITAAEGNGPINALDFALRKALTTFYPEINEMCLVDFRVRILEGSAGTGAMVRVLLDSRDKTDFWSTIGVSTNVIEASWHALVDSIQYKLSKDRVNKNTKSEEAHRQAGKK
jgi:2-isopropylmalate synthase